jgi:hypothetical protein
MTLLYSPQDYGMVLVNALRGVLGVELFGLGVLVILLFFIFKTEADTSVKIFLSMLSVMSLMAMGVLLSGDYIWLVGMVVFIGGILAAWGFTRLVGE